MVDQDVRPVNIYTSVIQSKPQKYVIRGQCACQSNILVCVMTCAICKIHYIGETVNNLNTRCRGHEINIKNLTDNPVSNHASYNHTIEDCLVCTMDIERDKNKILRLEDAR